VTSSAITAASTTQSVTVTKAKPVVAKRPSRFSSKRI
jgi:hypothetical protein